MPRFGICLCASLAVFLTLAAHAIGADPQPINVLFLMTDQHHYAIAGLRRQSECQDAASRSPGRRWSALHQGLLRHAVLLADAGSASVTGRYPSSFGLGRNIAIGPRAAARRTAVARALRHLPASPRGSWLSLPPVGQMALGSSLATDLLSRRGPGCRSAGADDDQSSACGRIGWIGRRCHASRRSRASRRRSDRPGLPAERNGQAPPRVARSTQGPCQEPRQHHHRPRGDQAGALV